MPIETVADVVSIAVVVVGVLAFGWKWWRHKRRARIIKDLSDLMGKAIQHENLGKHRVPDVQAWVANAKKIEDDAKSKAYELSEVSGKLVEWLGPDLTARVDANVDDLLQQQYMAILNKVIERIREILGRHDGA